MIFKNLGGFPPRVEIGKTLSKPIVLSEKSWAVLYNQLAKDNPASVILIRRNMKAVLGFTVRRHTEFVDISDMAEDFGMFEYASRKHPRSMICLDFYDDAKRTWFLLKYSDHINNE